MRNFILSQFTQIKWYWNVNSKQSDIQEVSKLLKKNLTDHKELLEAVVVENGLNIGTYDERIIKILRFVRQLATYKKEWTVYKMAEYWANVAESLENKQGDCDDYAILIFCLARIAGIPQGRVYLQCGQVKGGLHAYVKYYADYSTTVVFFIDWCYNYDGRDIGENGRTAHFEDTFTQQIDFGTGNYQTIIGFANDEVAKTW